MASLLRFDSPFAAPAFLDFHCGLVKGTEGSQGLEGGGSVANHPAHPQAQVAIFLPAIISPIPFTQFLWTSYQGRVLASVFPFGAL